MLGRMPSALPPSARIRLPRRRQRGRRTGGRSASAEENRGGTRLSRNGAHLAAVMSPRITAVTARIAPIWSGARLRPNATTRAMTAWTRASRPPSRSWPYIEQVTRRRLDLPNRVMVEARLASNGIQVGPSPLVRQLMDSGT